MSLLLRCCVSSRRSRRTPSTAPDPHAGFEGIWNSATATPLERPAQLKDKPFFTPEEAAEWERQFARAQRGAPARGRREATGTGTYNTFYREFGTRTVKTLRTSIITDPPDGRIPALTPAAAEIKRRRLEACRSRENPEDLGLQDQCLAFLTAGPPMLPYSYNSNYQIVQTRDAVLVHAEMIHDARIIHLDGRPHLPPSDQAVAGRFDRPLGGQHAGRRHDELQRRRRLLWRRRRQLRLGPQPAPGRTLQPVRRRYAALPVRDRQPDGVHAALERRADDGAVARADLRIRLPRRQLLVDEHAEGLPRRGALSGGSCPR